MFCTVRTISGGDYQWWDKPRARAPSHNVETVVACQSWSNQLILLIAPEGTFKRLLGTEALSKHLASCAEGPAHDSP